MIGTGRTAVGILEHAQLTDEDVVIVTAASGGLGVLFVQEAHAVGATVVALAGGPAKVGAGPRPGHGHRHRLPAARLAQQVRHALDGRPVTLALDGVGGATGRAVFELLGVGGRMVRFGWSSGSPTEIGESLSMPRQTSSV